MWPFKKKEEFDFNSLGNEMSSLNNDSSESSFGINDSNNQTDTLGLNNSDTLGLSSSSNTPDFDPNKSLMSKEDMHNMAASMSNSSHEDFPQPSTIPNGGTPKNTFDTQSQSFETNNDESNFNNQGSSQNFTQNDDHKLDMLNKQVEILTSKIELLKSNMDHISVKLNDIDQNIEKKLNSW